MIVDLGNARTLAEQALLNMERMDGTDMTDVGSKAKRGDTAAAEFNRRITYTIHLLERAAREAEAQYQRTRGFPDLLED